MEEFPPNSSKSKEEPKTKKVERVIEGEVTLKKRPLGSRMKETFFGGEAKSSVSYVFTDVVLPAVRDMVVDATVRGVQSMVYGPDSPRSKRSSRDRDPRPRVQYHTTTRRDRPGILPDQPPRAQIRTSRREFEDLVLSSRDEAEIVLERMADIIHQYDAASLADLYELTGLKSAHTDNKWGWTQLGGVAVRQIREGFIIEFPPLEEL